MKKILDFDTIIYHGPCSDGTGGLWCACHYKPIQTHVSCKAGSNPANSAGNFTGQTVLFVDICPKIDYLLDLVTRATHVVILDHHVSSERMILDNQDKLSSISNLTIEFDMGRSGCQITWDYFFPDTPRPFFIDYLGDRDLWTWLLPNSKEINSALYEQNYIDSWDLSKLTRLLIDPELKIKELESQGKLILQLNKRELDIGLSNAIDVKFIYEDIIYRIWLGGNISPGLRSDFGNLLCKKSFKDGKIPDFSATWQFDPKSNEWWISLRGIAGSPDLSIIASKMGGGGHYFASGWTITHEKNLRDFFIFNK